MRRGRGRGGRRREYRARGIRRRLGDRSHEQSRRDLAALARPGSRPPRERRAPRAADHRRLLPAPRRLRAVRGHRGARTGPRARAESRGYRPGGALAPGHAAPRQIQAAHRQPPRQRRARGRDTPDRDVRLAVGHPGRWPRPQRMAGLVVGGSRRGDRHGATHHLGRAAGAPGTNLLRRVIRLPRIGRPLLAPAALFLAITLPACEAPRLRPVALSPPSPEVARYAAAHRRSVELRSGFAGWAARASRQSVAGEVVTAELEEQLRGLKREYFAIRETLFELALLHASAVVEEPGRRDQRERLVEISLSLMAGTDLVTNFHAVAPVLAERAALRAVWNEADALHGIPEGGWEAALLAYRSAHYHDLFKTAIERAAWRAAAEPIREAIVRDGGLIRGAVHLRLHTVKREYLELREGLYGLAFKHLPKLTREDIPYPRAFRLEAVGISVLAAATLFENAHAIQAEILDIQRVKPLLNQGDPALGIRPGFWDHVEEELVRREFRILLEAGVQILEQSRSLPSDEDPFLAYVARELLATAAIEEARRDRAEVIIGWWLRRELRRANLLETGASEGQVQTSKAFGNFMGVFEFRKGKLFDQPEWIRFVTERLEPGDLLLEKTPFRLTDRFIPGHFGHVALYVGTQAQLTALGLGEHPWVRPYWAQLCEGRVIVEALRDGTQINTVEHFLNIDDLAILRPKPGLIPRADVLQAITLAFTHIGKKYDFAFDTNTWDTIVCSELAFQTYVNVRWPFARVLASYTISPDDVAVMAGSDPARPFELVAFVHDGRVVHDRKTGLLNERRYVELLGRRYEAALR